jgi:hypothetical protein
MVVKPMLTNASLKVIPVAPDELAPHLGALEHLLLSAAERNVFYEPWMLVPGIEAFGAGKKLVFVFVYRANPVTGTDLLCGFFPFERRRRFARLPARTLILWQYQECYLSTPIVRAGHETECFGALLDWARTSPDGADVIEGLEVGEDGPVFSALMETLESRHLQTLIDRRDRPLMLPRASSEEFLRQALSGDRRRVLRARQRNLEKIGPIEFTSVDETSLDRWIDDFMAMEASGWKGHAGVAAICHEHTRRYFRSVIQQAFHRGRLHAFTMTVGGIPVAARCSFSCGEGAFLYKSAYEEKYARYSPGGLLELERIRRTHEASNTEWVDSCVSASFDHYLPWLDRRHLADIAWSTGTWRGNLVMKMAPLVKKIKQAIAKRKVPANPKGEQPAHKPVGRTAYAAAIANSVADPIKTEVETGRKHG